MTHSQGMTLLAVGVGQQIGIDLECVRPLPDLDRLVSQCLSPAEVRALDAAELLDPLDSFYRYWTCKEACLKGLGIGLDRRLDSVRICAAGRRCNRDSGGLWRQRRDNGPLRTELLPL